MDLLPRESGGELVELVEVSGKLCDKFIVYLFKGIYLHEIVLVIFFESTFIQSFFGLMIEIRWESSLSRRKVWLYKINRKYFLNLQEVALNRSICFHIIHVGKVG